MKIKAIKMSSEDNVATAIDDIEEGERIAVKNDEIFEIEAAQQIPFGHKIALRDISRGDSIIKYGEVIGRATADIRRGEHVHVHNVESLRGRGDIAKR
ncbi:MAG: UxaA family hydrolase [Archaeoglobi archaeon]|nr:UxaA family hydrolase [Candidatus Mnemosynella bozhongmuii]